MTQIGNSGDNLPISPADRKMYEQEYKRGADLFKTALDQYAKSTNQFQKEEFKEVMDKAMDALNGAARALKQEAEAKKISQDYAAFQDKDDTDSINKLKADLDQAKKKLS